MKNFSYQSKFIFLNIIFVSCMMSLFLIGVLYTKDVEVQSVSNTNIQKKFNERESFLISKLENIPIMLTSISENSFFNDYFATNQKDNLLNLFKSIIAIEKNVSQIRYIDISGYELLRVDKDVNTQKIVSLEDTELQNKSNKAYFKYFTTLNQNEIGISSFDTNDEFAKQMQTTVLRYGKCIYKDGIKQGVLIINIDATDILINLTKSILFNIYLVDSNGKFILFNNEILTNKYLSDYYEKNIANEILTSQKYIGKNFYSQKLSLNTQENITMILEDKFEQEADKSNQFRKKLVLLASILIIIYIPFVIFLSRVPDKLLSRLSEANKELEQSIYNTKILEQKYKTLFETINDGIAIIDDNSQHILICNKAFENMIGYEKDTILHNNINIFYNSKESLIDLLKKQKKDEICLLDAIDLTTKNGTIVYVDVSISPMSLNGINYDIVIFRDISDKIKRDKEMKHKDKMLLQQSKMAAMGEMIGMIAHQWRQPLTAITAIIQSIDLRYQLDKLEPSFIKSQTKLAKDIVLYMSNTIDDFKDFFKPKVTKDKVFIAKLIQKTIDLLSPQFTQYSINVKLICDEDKELFIYSSELMQVILNIMNNAKDALVSNTTLEEFREIIITINSSDSTYIIITIQDNAGGIPLEYKDKIFEPYFSTKSKNGTGLGLYIGKIIIQEHIGGELYVENINRGALFTIKIPLTTIVDKV